LTAIREIRCPECGATRKALENALMLVCEYCGAFIGLDEGMDSRVDMARRAAELARNPTETSRRFNEVAGQMASAAQSGDPDAWRTIAREYYSLQAVLYPDTVPAGGREGVRDWINDAVTVGELNHFDPSVRPLFEQYSSGFGGLGTSSDPVAAARRLLDVCTAYNRALQDHPRCPGKMVGRDPRRLAITTIKSSLVGMSGMMGPDAVERIKSDVLGLSESASDACPECGAPLERDAGGRCAYCGSRLHVAAGDPWVEEQAMLFKQVAAASPAFTPDIAVSTAVGFVYTTLQNDPSLPAERAVRFFEKVLPRSSPEAIRARARQMLAGRDEFLASLDAAFASWSPEEG
jgi:DNA-directed RNA polymerase subunit RPC12/RpoP